MENQVLAYEEAHADSWKSIVVRPAYVTHGEPLLRFLPFTWYIPANELAASMVELAVTGQGESMVENAELLRRGRAVLRAKK